jgi:formylmethanofuran dehydrogenase subunit E
MRIGGKVMESFEEYYNLGLKFHGHKCPAMPMGLRAALAAMKQLGVSHAPDGQLEAILELDEEHCATCFADGVQVATGCTYGKGNIKRLGYGKWGLTLIDKKKNRAVRVVPKTEAMMKSKQSKFMELRKSGTPASQVPAEIADPLVKMVSNAPDEMLLNIGEIFTYEWKEPATTFESVICAQCGEMVVERNARLKEGKVVCKPCSGYED